MKVFFCGGSIAVATPSGIAVFDLATTSTTTLPRRPAAIIDALALSENRIAVVYDDKALVTFAHGATGWTAEGDVRTCAKKPTSLALLAAVPAVLVGEMSGDIIAYAASTGRRETRPVLTHTSSGVSTLATSSDGSLLFSGDEDGRIKITRMADLRLQAVCLPLGRSVAAVKALVDVGGHAGCAAGSLLFSAAADGSLSLWDATTGALLGHAEGPAGAESGAAAAGGAIAASAATEGGAAAAESPATPRLCLAGAPGAAAAAVAGSPAVRLAAVVQAAGGGMPRLECASLVLDSGAGGGGVQALATVPASAARILSPAAAPGDLRAFMLALCNSRAGGSSSSLRLRAFQAMAAVGQAALGGPLLERTDAEGGSAAARALAAVDWASITAS